MSINVSLEYGPVCSVGQMEDFLRVDFSVPELKNSFLLHEVTSF